MTIYQEFAQHLADVTGSSVTTSKLPAKPTSADDQWSVVAEGGEPETGGNFLLWKRVVNIRVAYRHSRTQEVYSADAVLLSAVASFLPTVNGPVLLRGVTPITDTDKDGEERQTASWQVQLTIQTK